MTKIRISIALIIICIAVYFWGGYRFTPFAAAKANGFVTEDYELIGEYKSEASTYYLFKSDEQQHYRTVYVNQHNLLYRSNVSTMIPYSQDSLQTIGGISIQNENEAATLFIIQSHDEQVASIRLQTDVGVEMKEIMVGEITYFLLPYVKQIDQLQAVALDENGNQLYYYGYENGNSFYHLKWHEEE